MREQLKDTQHSQPRGTEDTCPQTLLCTTALSNATQIFSKAPGPGTVVDKRQTVPVLLDSEGDKRSRKEAKMPGFLFTDKINSRSETYKAAN